MLQQWCVKMYTDVGTIAALGIDLLRVEGGALHNFKNELFLEAEILL